MDQQNMNDNGSPPRQEDQVLVLAPQRTGKSWLIADRILCHPGPALIISTRPDLYTIKAAARARRGPIA